MGKLTAHHDHTPAFRRPSAPRVVPPVRRDVATIRREVEKRKALARIRGVR